jgi:hypothetical protein
MGWTESISGPAAHLVPRDGHAIAHRAEPDLSVGVGTVNGQAEHPQAGGDLSRRGLAHPTLEEDEHPKDTLP